MAGMIAVDATRAGQASSDKQPQAREDMINDFVLPLNEIGEHEVERCGGKAMSLGKLIRLGATVPPGFCIVSDALPYVLESNGLTNRIADIAARLDFEDFAAVEARTGEIRAMIENVTIPSALQQAIVEQYERLISDGSKYVAVRSSVAVRETSISSFPGMMDTYHYVLGAQEVLAKVRECWASLWSARATFLSHRKRVSHDKVVIAPVVQAMVNSTTAGVLFTANPVTRDKGEVMIEANWGLGESVVSGRSMNDFFVLDKATLEIRQRKIAPKTVMVVMDAAKGSGRCELPVPPDRSKVPTLSDSQLLELVRTAKGIEEHYGFEVDVEWAYQGNKLFILQARKIRDLD
jgi:phosphoenolpyruvate synthase/pyruvate phosphate dikinase